MIGYGVSANIAAFHASAARVRFPVSEVNCCQRMCAVPFLVTDVFVVHRASMPASCAEVIVQGDVSANTAAFHATARGSIPRIRVVFVFEILIVDLLSIFFTSNQEGMGSRGFDTFMRIAHVINTRKRFIDNTRVVNGVGTNYYEQEVNEEVPAQPQHTSRFHRHQHSGPFGGCLWCSCVERYDRYGRMRHALTISVRLSARCPRFSIMISVPSATT